MKHLDATLLLARMAYRHRENFTTEERLSLLDACALVLDAPESTKAQEAADQLRVAILERKRADSTQGEFLNLLEGNQP